MRLLKGGVLMIISYLHESYGRDYGEIRTVKFIVPNNGQPAYLSTELKIVPENSNNTGDEIYKLIRKNGHYGIISGSFYLKVSPKNKLIKVDGGKEVEKLWEEARKQEILKVLKSDTEPRENEEDGQYNADDNEEEPVEEEADEEPEEEPPVEETKGTTHNASRNENRARRRRIRSSNSNNRGEEEELNPIVDKTVSSLASEKKEDPSIELIRSIKNMVDKALVDAKKGKNDGSSLVEVESKKSGFMENIKSITAIGDESLHSSALADPKILGRVVWAYFVFVYVYLTQDESGVVITYKDKCLTRDLVFEPCEIPRDISDKPEKFLWKVMDMFDPEIEKGAEKLVKDRRVRECRSLKDRQPSSTKQCLLLKDKAVFNKMPPVITPPVESRAKVNVPDSLSVTTPCQRRNLKLNIVDGMINGDGSLIRGIGNSLRL